MTPGYVMFRLDQRTFALRLDDVREIVRLEGLERLPGTRAPMAGVIVLRGNPLPVLDVRVAGSDEDGDVLVMAVDGDPVGVAVDQVLAVLAADELPEAAEAPPKSLPPYVVGVRRNASGPVLLVDLHKMLDTCADGWVASLPGREPVSV
ncbi:MAG: chemotaxis protein CheW [Frankiaceae bacterium]|nr:chemotaxis protein CheW [Frankiaceae bacterium]MBV9869798.1 chemotaxis protein CheW [Frankiaceae bacterium]